MSFYGLAAVYVKQTGQSDRIYYAHSDHLGSIVKLTDAGCNTVFEATYDAWGRQTVTDSTFKFHRGYTGHEHLPEFGLINMNARLYDPVLGRFLSPDPYVQAPEFSQSFNRYSYCVNNPLIYTDPSGEIFGVDDAIIIAVMAYLRGVQSNFFYAAAHGNNPFNPGDWNWSSAGTYMSIAGGALGGANMAGLNIPYTQVPGMLTNGGLQAGIQVALNGISNLTDGRKFFDNWYWSAGTGFASGAFPGYNLAKAKDLNYWWGNKVAYNRTSWSFFNVDKPDYVIDFGIGNMGSRAENDCVPTTFIEIETKRGGSRTYEYFKTKSGYIENQGVFDDSKTYESRMYNTFNNVETMNRKDFSKLLNASYMNNAANNGEMFSIHFSGHADNVRGLEVYTRAPWKNTLLFRQSAYNFSNSNSGRHYIWNVFRLF